MSLWYMKPHIVHSCPYSRIFLAPKCSIAYCFSIFIYILILILPFVLAFASSNFWVKEGTFVAFPHVRTVSDCVSVLCRVQEQI